MSTTKLRNLLFTTGSSLALLVSISPLLPASAQPLAQQPECQTFSQTGKTICGRFLQYWRENGGLMQQGYPISPEMTDTASPTAHLPLNMQYFERAVFEAHPENKAPYDVLLSLLGTMRFKEKYPNGVTEQPDDAKAGAGMTFPQTGKTVRGVFLDYWKSHGGLAQQGYPISNLIIEKSEIDGKDYVMQYFERAVFELHTENQPPFNVLLSQLGTIQYNKKYGGGTPPPQPGSPLAAGIYGGSHIRFEVTSGGVAIEFDCAHATIPSAVTVANGKFDVTGTFVQEHGGPTYPGDETADTHPARFTGTVDGPNVTLTLTLTDQTKVYGPYTAILGKQPTVFKCL